MTSDREPLYNTKQRSCKVMKAVLYADNFGRSVVVWVKIRSHGHQRTLSSWDDRSPGLQRTAVAPLQLSGREQWFWTQVKVPLSSLTV